MDVGMVFEFIAVGLQDDQITGNLYLSISETGLWTAKAGVRPENLLSFDGIDLRYWDR